MDYSALQNGSDIRGYALAEGGHAVDLTERACRDIGRGLALWLCRGERRACRVAIGRDCRLSGKDLARWLAEALCEQGMCVTDMGEATTPAMFMTTVTPGYAFDAAVMVTASHLPFDRNGYKFFTARGGFESADIRTLLALAGTDEATGLAPGSMTRDAFMEVYAASLRRRITEKTGLAQPFAGLRLVVDAGNGMGGFYAARVLQKLGADIAGSCFLEPDGRFPNHIPNPESAEAMAALRQAVAENAADFGVSFDTDVDRAGAVLSDGTELNRNRLIAAVSAILLREHPGAAIVTDSTTSTGLAAFIAAHGGVHRRFKRGYRNVINEAVRLNAAGTECQLAMETSGHGAMKENYFLDDGAYLVTRLLIELVRRRAAGERLEDLLAGLREPVESREFRLNIRAGDFKAYGAQVLDALAVYTAAQSGWRREAQDFEGVRVNLDGDHGCGWFLLRMSLHDPLLPLNIESDEAGGVERIARELLPFLRRFEALELGALERAAEGGV